MGSIRQLTLGIALGVLLVITSHQPFLMGAPVWLAATDVATVNLDSDSLVDELLQQARSLYDLKDYRAAQRLYNQALIQSQGRGYTLGIAVARHYIARISFREKRYQAALSHYHETLDALSGLTSARANRLRADTNFQLAKIYASILDQNLEALPFLEEALAYYQEFEPSSVALGDALNGLGYIHHQLGALGDALLAYKAALEIYQTLTDLNDQAAVLNNIGGLQVYLGQYVEAQLALEQALEILDNLPNYEDYRISVLNNLGWLYERQYRYNRALALYQTAQAARLGVDRGVSFSRLASNIAYVHTQKNELEQALSHYREALILTDDSPQVAERVEIFNGIGAVYFKQERYGDVWDSYHRSLRLATQIAQPLSQSRTLVELGRLFETIQQPLVAIAFYKQAINQIEQVRARLRSLPLETQQRYTATVADSYRELAALLLDQERVFEAQQVLDLLKIQELEDYLHDVRQEQVQTISTIPYLTPERDLLNQHRLLLLEDLSDTDPVLRLEDFLEHPKVAAALKILKQRDGLQPESLRRLQHTLQTLPHTSAILYPLVLEDRLELLLVPPAGPPIHQTTDVAKTALTEQVNTLRTGLEAPSGDVKDIAGSLYDSIIRPFQQELHGVENIIYIPDSVLHYIPLSVLYDSRQRAWLAEQYTSQNLTASDIGDLTQLPRQPLNVLAGAFADISQTFETMVDREAMRFNGLTYAGLEVSFLAENLPATQVLLDADFSRDNLETQLDNQNIVHLATHAAFVPGQPEDSFILLGDGDTITLRELRDWSLPNVDLVVLSACQTGISHIEDGLEILGMGFQVQRTEARAALASLWWVDDRSTSQLMQQFYTELAAGATKVDALQNAQLHLIANGRSEPYYWAPFVLIGNGL
ncbi:MAG: CHAT domain-containing protein [Leptolyngbyaceae cyanobacterium]